MQIDTNWYCNQQPKHHFITVPTRTILHPQIEANAVTDLHSIPTSVCNRTQARKFISRQSICLTYSYYDCILEEISRREKIEFERDVDFYSEIWMINMRILNDFYIYS